MFIFDWVCVCVCDRRGLMKCVGPTDRLVTTMIHPHHLRDPRELHQAAMDFSLIQSFP